MVMPFRKLTFALANTAAVLAAQEAGVRVMMLTGDHPTTAREVARQMGITGKTVSGAELEACIDRGLASIAAGVPGIPAEEVIARLRARS